VGAIHGILELARRANDNKLLEWAGLAALDATDIGEQLDMLFDVEAEPWRVVIRARSSG
jgi:hypothetical protein